MVKRNAPGETNATNREPRLPGDAVGQSPLPRAVRAFCLGLPILLMFHLPAQAQTKQTPTQPAAAKQATARKDLLGDPLPDGAIARLGTLRLRHQDTVGALAFTLDGR